MKHHTKNGTPMSAPMALILDAAIAKGFETKALKYGVRIMGTDCVCSDYWNGVYLCKTKTSGFTREELGVAKLKPTDQGCWGVCVDRYATDPEGAAEQAKDIVALAAKKGYLANLAEDFGISLDAQEAVTEEVAVEATPEEVAAEPAAEEPKATESPKKRTAGRRKKGKGKKAKAEDNAPATELDADLAAL
jgi:hypothetical protein